MLEFSQKVVLITGVSSGLGRAMAKCFAAKGFAVAGISRCQPDFPIDLWIECDVTDPAARQTAFDRIISGFGKLDILVNNAGMGAYATWEELPENELRTLFELDFFALVEMTKLFLPLLKKNGGSVINISSAAGRLYVPCMGAYCAAKAAVAMFSNSLGIELKNSGVHVLDVAPGQVNTGFSSRSFGRRRPPESPGASSTSPEKMAGCVFNAWQKKKKRITYPRPLAFALFLVRAVIPGIYEKISLKLWKLQSDKTLPDT